MVRRTHRAQNLGALTTVEGEDRGDCKWDRMTALINQITRTIRRFLTWWLSELGSLVPTQIRRALFQQDATVTLCVEDSDVGLLVEGRNGPEELGKVPTANRPQEAVAGDLRKLLADHHLHHGRADLVLANDLVLERSVDLPLDAADSLTDVLAFEMDRLTPFTSEEVYYDYCVTGSDPDLKQLQVTMMIGRRAIVDKAATLAKDAGLQPVLARSRSFTKDGSVPLNLLPVAARQATGTWFRHSTTALLCILAIFAGLSVYLPLERGKRDLERAVERANELRVVGAEVADLDRQVVSLQERHRFLSSEKRRRLPSIAVLDELTRRLPDGSWLLHFDLQDDVLRIAGYAEDPSQLIRLLERSPVLSSARFTSPVTKDTRVEMHRFSLNAHVALREEP